MSANTTRVQVSLKPHEYQLLRRLSDLQGRSMSAIVAEIWETVHPVMERVAVVLDAAKKAQLESTSGLRKSAERAEQEIVPLLAQAIDQFDIFLADAGLDASGLHENESGRPGASHAVGVPARGGRRGSTPVPSNHGGQVVKSRRKRGSSA